MLPSTFRNFKPYEVVKTARRGFPKKSENIMVRYLADNRKKKVLVMISAKTESSAVKRNSLRRKTYAAIEELFDRMPSGLFFISLRPRKELSYKDILSELKSLVIYEQ